ncbi:hypothetical protein ABIA30_005408 [Mycobacterium sp. MAA66]|uniref:hypothetical protein n=1 Tax=Mycobacterium sp. MAA66 TaxID=3156297 RepID=UPI00351268D3
MSLWVFSHLDQSARQWLVTRALYVALSVTGHNLAVMYLQSRTKRWLQMLHNAKVELVQGRESIGVYLANAHIPGVRQISERDKRIAVVLPLDQIALTHESQPLTPGTWLAETLSGVIAAANNIAYGERFIDTVTALLTAIEQAIPALEAQETEPDSSVDEIVADLERALLVSLVVTLTAHGTILPKESEWTSQHQRFLNGHRSDLGHYLEVSTLRFVDEPGPGRIHMQHVVSACDAGMTAFAVGAAGTASVDHHPEMLAVSYAQWFTYIFAIWEEQFRGRLAKFWDAQLDSKIRRSDILVDYFGDIRLIRNDFVHNKGICDESANVAVLQWNFIDGQPIEIGPGQMISLITFFPYRDLRTPPTPQPSTGLKSAPGRIDAQLLEDIQERARALGLSDNELASAVYSQWLQSNSAT